jgi:hypothetical protein
MKIALSLAALVLFAAGDALARDPSIINQASTYEQTLKFYMHPAHFFFGAEPSRLGQHPAVLVKQRAARQAAQAETPAVRVHPALVARPSHRSLVAHAD